MMTAAMWQSMICREDIGSDIEGFMLPFFETFFFANFLCRHHIKWG